MARSLLLTRVGGLLLLAAASSMSACIIPVAPSFQDPPTQPTSVPELKTVGLTPVPLSIFPIQGASFEFDVNVTDPDPDVPLYSRWVFDYPPHSQITRVATESMIPPGTTQQVSQTASCNSIDATAQPANGEHRLMLLVATSPFEDPDPTNPYDIQTTVNPNAHFAEADWIIIFQSGCPILPGK